MTCSSSKTLLKRERDAELQRIRHGPKVAWRYDLWRSEVELDGSKQNDIPAAEVNNNDPGLCGEGQGGAAGPFEDPAGEENDSARERDAERNGSSDPQETENEQSKSDELSTSTVLEAMLNLAEQSVEKMDGKSMNERVERPVTSEAEDASFEERCSIPQSWEELLECE